MTPIRNWAKDIAKGKIKEQIFKEDFLDYLNIGYLDVSEEKNFQRADIDLICHALGGVDVKSYRDNGLIPMEEMSVVETNKKGWIYESKAKYFVFVSTQTRTMLILRNDDIFKNWWQRNRERWELRRQSTGKGGNFWHSEHRSVPVQELNISWFKKNNKWIK